MPNSPTTPEPKEPKYERGWRGPADYVPIEEVQEQYRQETPAQNPTIEEDEALPHLDEAYAAWLKFCDRYSIAHSGPDAVTSQDRRHAYLEGYLDAKESNTDA